MQQNASGSGFKPKTCLLRHVTIEKAEKLKLTASFGMVIAIDPLKVFSCQTDASIILTFHVFATFGGVT